MLEGVAHGDSLVAGPDQNGWDPALAAKADLFERQLRNFTARPLGWGLEAWIHDPAARAAVDEFFASGEDDFLAQSGLHPYEVVSEYGEFGDLGMFGGVEAAGHAFRYAVLRDGAAPAEQVEAARTALLAAMDGLHWYTRVTGEPGAVARGLRRILPADGDPPLPGTPPETVPLFDADGDPLPGDKSAVWRDDRSGELPFLIWEDDTSKDQLDGWVFALGVVWDVAVDDPTIPRDRVDRLVEDARAFGERLMRVVEIEPGLFVDIVIVDPDGRPTSFHDVSAEELIPGVVIDGVRNGFNAWMSLSFFRTLYHVTGDERFARFYYDELIDQRGYLDACEESVSLVYVGNDTNYSNVNMAFVASWGLLRYETDPEVAARVRAILEDHLYAPGRSHEARLLGQSFFDLVYAGFGPAGASGPGRVALERGLATLREHPSPPYWDLWVENCDAAEIASLDCVGNDGTPLPLDEAGGRGLGVAAIDAVPMRIRPPSNFRWRDDPHRVNGGGSNLLNPGGDFHGAYWMGRFLTATLDGIDNVSPRARPAPDEVPTDPSGDAGPDAAAPGAEGTDAGADGGTAVPEPPADPDGCGCRTSSADAGAASLAATSLALLIAARGRRRR